MTNQSDKADENPTEVVSELIARARAAQAVYAKFDQSAVDEVVTAVAWTLLDPENNRRLAEQAVADTGLGRVDDKITKNHRKTLGLLRDLKHARTVGVVAEYPEKGLIEIARPVVVVGAVVPSTNPAATPYNKTLNALKGGNAMILAPSPKGQAVCDEVVKLMRGALRQVGAPEDLVQKLPQPVSKATTYELMRQGKMPESETIMGQLLNAVFATGDTGATRQQEINASKAPPFDFVRRYLGPAGLFATAEDDGWFFKGFTLPKQQ